MRFVDSHLHLDGPGIRGAIDVALANKTILVTCGTDRKTSLRGVKLTNAHPGAVIAFVGVHPSEATHERNLSWLGPVLDKASGIGEVGLDPKYSGTGDRSIQMRVLRRQLEAAEGASKPVQVHSRGAEEDCLKALSEFGLKSVLMHWFEGEELIREVKRRRYFVSFGPALLYSRKLQRIARNMGRERVLVESDFPVPYTPLGGVSGPSLIPSVVFKLSELWGLSFDETRAATTENANLFLSLSGKG